MTLSSRFGVSSSCLRLFGLFWDDLVCDPLLLSGFYTSITGGEGFENRQGNVSESTVNR